MRPERPLVIAHRGASGSRPENTMPAFDLAIEMRADMIEIDLHRTRDGEIAVAHDAELAGLGGRGEIGEATLAEVQALDAGGGERVPSLDAVLDRFGARIPFNLELKRARRGFYPGLEAAAVEAAERRGLLERTLYSSFDDPVLAELRARGDGVRLGVLVSPRAPDGWLERARAVAAEAVNLHAALASGEALRRAHGEGLAVYVYTVDAPEAMQRLLDLGVDGLFTNHPERMRPLVD